MNDVTVILSVTVPGADWNISGQWMSSPEVDSCHRTNPVHVRVQASRDLPAGVSPDILVGSGSTLHSGLDGRLRSSRRSLIFVDRVLQLQIPDFKFQKKWRDAGNPGICHRESGIRLRQCRVGEHFICLINT